MLAYDECGSLSQPGKDDSRSNTQECLAITRAELYQTVSSECANQIIEAEMLGTVEFEAKIFLALLDQFNLF